MPEACGRQVGTGGDEERPEKGPACVWVTL